ncbi:hypothetical protein [Treponema sp.]|uniref:hypothetical protein n=1 Tax=Treponema sp. TaxID=166 RepID=UPI0038908C04
MKKIVGTIAAIALATSAVFADVNVGMGFSRAIWTPIAYDGEDARMDISTSWGATPRIGASISGASDECGVVADMKFDGGNVAVNDNAYVWVKPISWLTINIGQSFDDTLRGNACFGSWDWLRPSAALTGEDFIFTRICANPVDGAWAPLVGALVKLDPIEGLHIGVAFPIQKYAANADPNTGAVSRGNGSYYANQKIEDVFKNIQVQAGYTIDGIGQIKAQYIGVEGVAGIDDVAQRDDWAQIEAAFCLKAVENMTLDIGAKFRTYEDAPIDVAVYWAMPFDALKVHASVGVTLDSASDSTGLVAGAGIDYDLGNGLGLSADFRFGKEFSDADTDPAIAFGVWVNKGIANGTVGIGAQGAMHARIRDFEPVKDDSFVFAVPVRVQCFF